MWRFLKSLTAPANGSTADSGTLVELPAHLQRLLAAPASAFLIVEVPGVEDAFLQFTAGGGVIQLDYPLITDAQTGREHALRAACDAVGHPAREAHGSDGSRTLNSDLPADPSPAAAGIERILQMVFGVGSRTELKFIGEGLAPTARRQSGQMRADVRGGPIQWRMHLAASPEHVYTALDSDDGRAGFWAESAIERSGVIEFRFVNGQTCVAPILERRPPHVWAIEYFGTPARFELMPDGRGETDLLLTHTGVAPGDWHEVHAGWLNVLFPLKAWVVHGVDLRNHDPARTWDRGYADQ